MPALALTLAATLGTSVVWRVALPIRALPRNPKLEARNPKQIRSSKSKARNKLLVLLKFRILDFVFWATAADRGHAKSARAGAVGQHTKLAWTSSSSSESSEADHSSTLARR